VTYNARLAVVAAVVSRARREKILTPITEPDIAFA
jgi:hypothetical protein